MGRVMALTFEIRVLEPRDDRSAFRSGDDDLDRFFRRFASQNQFLPISAIPEDG